MCWSHCDGNSFPRGFDSGCKNRGDGGGRGAFLAPWWSGLGHNHRSLGVAKLPSCCPIDLNNGVCANPVSRRPQPPETSVSNHCKSKHSVRSRRGGQPSILGEDTGRAGARRLVGLIPALLVNPCSPRPPLSPPPGHALVAIGRPSGPGRDAIGRNAVRQPRRATCT